MALTEQTKILDVGAQVRRGDHRDLQLIDIYPWKHNITAVNVLEEHVQQIKEAYPQVNAIRGDACELPLADKSFDLVYSNAVIEHVGDFQRQRKMASEVRRVGKHWFVTTPNRWFPFEFHLRLPLVTWLPGRLYLKIGSIYRFSHIEGRYMTGLDCSDIELLTARQMRKCFPESKIIKHRTTFMAETLIAWGPVQGQ